MVQSLLIITMEICLLIPLMKLENPKLQLSTATQDLVTTVSMVSSFVEYALLGINIFVIVQTAV